jgi:hypothetical protein
MNRHLARLGVTLSILLVGLIYTSTAFADVAVSKNQKLRIQVDPTQSGCATSGSTAGWVAGSDSPSDTNSRLLSVHVGTGGCVVLFSKASYNKTLPASSVKNLSYEYRNEGTAIGAGQFYLAVEFLNGDVAYLDPAYCSHPVTVSGGTWLRSDFTGFTSDCGFYVSDTSTSGSTFYSADGTNSAWDVYVAANPHAQVVHRYMVFSFGDHQLDLISLGTGWMFTRSNGSAVQCTSEGSC